MRYSQKSNSYLRNALTSAHLRIPGAYGTWMYEQRPEEGLAVA